MYTKDAIRYSLMLADQAMKRTLATIEDAPLTFPTENGGCHPLWVVGHLAFVEGVNARNAERQPQSSGALGGDFRAGYSSYGGRTPVSRLRESPGTVFTAQRQQSATSRIPDRSGSRQADALAAEGPRRALRNIWQGSADHRNAPDGPSRANHRRNPRRRPSRACAGGGEGLAPQPHDDRSEGHGSV